MDDEEFLVPTPDVYLDDIAEALSDLGAAEQEPDEGEVRAWILADTRVHYFMDAGLFVEQLAIQGRAAGEVAAMLRRRLPTYSPDDMPELFDQVDPDDDEELSEKLAILAAVAPKDADPQLVELFGRGFDHPDSLVREQAALVATVPAWPELRPPLERLREDQDDRVRRAAALALEEIDKAAGKG